MPSARKMWVLTVSTRRLGGFLISARLIPVPTLSSGGSKVLGRAGRSLFRGCSWQRPTSAAAPAQAALLTRPPMQRSGGHGWRGGCKKRLRWMVITQTRIEGMRINASSAAHARISISCTGNSASGTERADPLHSLEATAQNPACRPEMAPEPPQGQGRKTATKAEVAAPSQFRCQFTTVGVTPPWAWDRAGLCRPAWAAARLGSARCLDPASAAGSAMVPDRERAAPLRGRRAAGFRVATWRGRERVRDWT